MESGAKLPYFNIIPARVDPVGQQHHNNGAIRFHPEGSSGVPQMAKGAGGKPTTGGGTHRGGGIKPGHPLSARLFLYELPKHPAGDWVYGC